jgi:monoamine oxidase
MQEKTSFKKSFYSLSLSTIFILGSVFNVNAEPFPDNSYSDVIVVGGGLSGLTTAYKLKQAGISCRVLELSPRVGGRARSAKYDEGSVVEAGLAEFWESNPAFDLIKELKLPYTSSLTYSSIMIDKKLYPFTQNTNDEFLKYLFNPTEYKLLMDWNKQMDKYSHQIKSKKLDKYLLSLQHISFAEWIEKTKLSKKIKEWIRISLQVEIGTEWDKISALDGIAEWHIFLGKGETPYELENGNESLPNALAEKIGKENIGLNMQVMKFNNNKNGVEIEAMDASNFKHYKYKAKYAVSAIPLYRLAELQFSPTLSPEKQEAISTQTWGSYFTAHVFMSPEAKKYWTNSKGESHLPILSDSQLGVIYSATESKKDNAFVLNLLITGETAEKFNYRAILFENVRNDLNLEFNKIWPGSSKYIKKYQFYRYHPRAIASWPVGRSRFDKLSESIRKPQGNIYFAGDFTESSHSDGAVYSALRVVNDILAREKKKQKN